MNVTNITVSYTRKLNHALYGGGAYESSDHFVSLGAEVDEGENILVAHQELKDTAHHLVDKATEDEITSFLGGTSADEFYSYLRDLVAGRAIDPEFYEQCNSRQKAVLQAAKRGLQMKKRDDAKK